MGVKIKRNILVKVDEELFIRIEKQAKKERRSKTAFINCVVEEYLKGKENAVHE